MAGKPPVEKVRDRGLEAAIWENEGQDGVYYTVSLSRSYKVKDETTGQEEWRSTTQLRPFDLLQAGELLRLAWYKVRSLEGKA